MVNRHARTRMVGGGTVWMRNGVFDYFRGTLNGWRRVEFPTLEHFIEDVASEGIQTVRIDLFSEVRQSELSFIYYITPKLFVTAQVSRGGVQYEYTESLGTTSITSKTTVDQAVLEPARARVEEVKNQLVESKFAVRHGRYALPQEFG